MDKNIYQNKNIIELKNIYFSYKENEPFFENISIGFEKGDFISILGPNGSGKTTLLNLINATLYPDKGDIFINGVNIRNLKRKNIARIISFLPQFLPDQIPFTVFEIILMGRYPHKKIFQSYDSIDLEIVNKYLKFLDLYNLKDEYFSNLSGGEKRRVMLVQSLVQETEIIMLDEPDSFLDINHKVEVYSFLEKLNKELGKTIIVISHDFNLAFKYSKKMMILNRGKVVLYGKTKSSVNKEIIDRVFNTDIKILKIDGNPVIIY